MRLARRLFGLILTGCAEAVQGRLKDESGCEVTTRGGLAGTVLSLLWENETALGELMSESGSERLGAGL